MGRLSGILTLLIVLMAIGAMTVDQWQMPLLTWATGILAAAWFGTGPSPQSSTTQRDQDGSRTG